MKNIRKNMVAQMNLRFKNTKQYKLYIYIKSMCFNWNSQAKLLFNKKKVKNFYFIVDNFIYGFIYRI